MKASSYSELRRFINFLRIGEVGEARYPSRLATSDDSLATASGKTFIAVMMIKELRGQLGTDRKAIFLVNSVAILAVRPRRKIVGSM